MVRVCFRLLSAAGDWVKKGSCPTLWAVPPHSRVFAHIRVGKAQLSGHKLEGGGGHCFLDCGWLSHSLMKPWCAEVRCANYCELRIFTGTGIRMWGGTAMMSRCLERVGRRSSLSRWKVNFCSHSAASSCWLDRGDVLIMDGRCQDEFVHCANPSLEQERIKVTFRWILF